ncbi:MAG: hypothetical protein BAJALOKI1v1_640015 [Promethearchaeota archaeon]|nr:MAG: hypothetical protein BAJALOKI1v1_640015 [Candidatus Lokiarchaeota archaeon]
MLIREVGIILGGLPLVYVNYHESSDKKIDEASKGALICSILQFAENVMRQYLESFESSKFRMLFKRGKIQMLGMSKESEIFAYIIINKDEVFTKKAKKHLNNLLEIILKEFIETYNGLDESKISQFQDFKIFINKTLGSLTKTLEEKFTSLFS